jgi:hypothetical protein
MINDDDDDNDNDEDDNDDDNDDDDDDDVYLDKLQTRGVKKSILYIWNVEYSQEGIRKEK